MQNNETEPILYIIQNIKISKKKMTKIAKLLESIEKTTTDLEKIFVAYNKILIYSLIYKDIKSSI